MRVHLLLSLFVIFSAHSVFGWDSSRCSSQGGNQCGDMTLCEGNTRRGLCPGPSNIRCCFGRLVDNDDNEDGGDSNEPPTSTSSSSSSSSSSKSSSSKSWTSYLPWNRENNEDESDSSSDDRESKRVSTSSIWDTVKGHFSKISDHASDHASTFGNHVRSGFNTLKEKMFTWGNGINFGDDDGDDNGSNDNNNNNRSHGDAEDNADDDNDDDTTAGSSSGPLRVENLGGKRWKVSYLGKSVSFTFCTAGGTTRSGSPWPHKYNSLGPKCTNLQYGGSAGDGRVELSASDLISVGVSPSWAKIMQGIMASESGNKFGSINTYDTEIVSWGAFQFAAKRGPFTSLLAGIKLNPKTSGAFDKYFERFGIDAKYHNIKHKNWGGIVSIKKCSDWESHPGCVGSRSVTIVKGKPAASESQRIEEGWIYLRTRPDLMGLFYLAGTDKTIAAAQVASRAGSFKRIMERKYDGKAMKDMVTSEYAVARLAYALNGSPQRGIDIFKSVLTSHPNGPWSKDVLAKLTSKMHAVPRFESGGGALLSKEPGSFRW